MGKSRKMEASGPGRRSRVPVDLTNRSCFLCLINLGPGQEPKGSLFPSAANLDQSLSLSRYLELDKNRNVLQDHGSGTLPSPSATATSPSQGEDRRQLKVPMCDHCASVNGRFLELHRQLEKIELEVISCLGIIYDKMATAEKNRRPPKKDTFGDKNEPRHDNCMRKEVMQKCSEKLGWMLPRVNLGLLPEGEADSHSIPSRVTPDIKIEVGLDLVEGSQASDSDTDDDNGDPSAGETEGTFEDPAPSPYSAIDPEEEEGVEYEETEKIDYRFELISAGEPSPDTSSGPQSTFDPKTCQHTCQLCSEQFKTELKFLAHFNRIHGLLKFKCKICFKIYARRDDFGKHYRDTHMERKFRCPQCPKSFILKSMLTQHQRKKHPTGGQPVMGKPTLDPLTGRFKCTLCPMDFKNGRHIYDHFKRVHLQIKYKCGTCQREFSDRNDLKIHEMSLHQGIRFQCKVCSKSFSMKTTLTSHLRRTPCGQGMGLKPPPPREMCHLCGKDFYDKAKVTKHLAEVHSGARDHLCDLCGKGFKNKCHLRIHKEGVHEGKKMNPPAASKSKSANKLKK